MIRSKEVDPGSLFGLAARLLNQHQSYLLKDESLSCQLSVILILSQVHVARWNLLQGTEGAGKKQLNIYQQSWSSGKVPDDWTLANVTPIFKKGRKEDLGNDRPVSLTSVPEKVMEQIILGETTQHMRGIQGIGPSQHGFIKGRSCLTDLISLYDWVTRLVDKRKAVDVVYLVFSKAFDTVSHSTLLEKLAACGLDRYTLL